MYKSTEMDIYLAVLVVTVRLMMSVQMSEGCMVSCEQQTEAKCGEQSFYTRPGDMETWRQQWPRLRDCLLNCLVICHLIPTSSSTTLHHFTFM